MFSFFLYWHASNSGTHLFFTSPSAGMHFSCYKIISHSTGIQQNLQTEQHKLFSTQGTDPCFPLLWTPTILYAVLLFDPDFSFESTCLTWFCYSNISRIRYAFFTCLLKHALYQPSINRCFYMDGLAALKDYAYLQCPATLAPNQPVLYFHDFKIY